VLGAALAACDRQKAWAVAGCAAAVLNPLANLVAIPFTSRAFGNGAVGASIVTIVTELFMFAIAVRLRPDRVLDRQTAWYLGRCAVACLALVAIVLAARDSPLAVRVAFGVVAYGAASVGLRTLSLPRLYRAGLRYLGPHAQRKLSGTG
jgi:O-antigen/teichoic acid export membrane protein